MRMRAALIAVLATALAPFLTAAPAHAARVGDYSIIGHRGYAGYHTENSLAAARAAARRGATTAEFDVRITADGTFAVMHDRSLTRTTRCSGYVDQRTRAELRDCRLNNGERVPMATHWLRTAADRNLNLFLEIKADPLHRWTPEKFTELADLIGRRDMAGRTTLFSFGADELAAAKQAASWLPTVWISKTWPGYAAAQANADNVAIHARDLTEYRVNRLHRLGVDVYGRNSNRVRDWRKYRSIDVDGLLVDDVPGYVRWRY